MSKKSLLIGILLLPIMSFAQERSVGFKNGNIFESQRISGEARVSCVNSSGFRETRFLNCAMEILNPREMEYFVGPLTDADSVKLTAIRADGSEKSKSAKYDGKVGISKSKFNLWIATISQSPLLGLGENKISYQLMKKDVVVTGGEFVAQVNRVNPAYCRTASYNDPNTSCLDASNYCGRYFRDQNYCQ